MTDVCCPEYSPCNPNQAPGPPCASPAIYIGLVAAPVALFLWLRRNLHRPLLEQLPDEGGDQIPAIPEVLEASAASTSASASAACSSITPPQAEAARHSDGSGPSSGSDEASRAELAPSFINATINRSGDVAGILNEMLNAFGEILLDINSSDESTIHPANGVLIQSMEIFYGNTDGVLSLSGTGDYTIGPYSVMFDCWVCKLEEDAECICQGEKGRRYIFLLNNTYDVWQMICSPRAPFSNLKLTSRLIPMIQRYKKSYFDECWVPLSNPCRLDKFTSDFLMISNRQMIWKVTADLKYKLRQQIVDFIVPPYEVFLHAVKANRSRFPEMVYRLKRVMAGKKKQKKFTAEALKKIIGELFEG